MRALFFISILMLTGCNLFPTPAAVHDFGSPAIATGSADGDKARQSALTVDAPKWLYDNRIRYRLLYAEATQVRFYTLDRWLAPPPELFEHLLANNGTQWLAPINVSLTAFEQQFTAPGKSQAFVQFTATKYTTDNKQPVSKREFTFKQLCPTADAKGAVTGFSVLAKQASQTLQAWANGIHPE
jgi:cholesterol transport system auxiliary component